MKNLFLVLPLFSIVAYGCLPSPGKISPPPQSDSTNKTAKSEIHKKIPVASAATILSRKEVPILCYHQIRDWKSTDSKRAKDYIVPVSNFKEQMKWLADSGYHTISPDQLYEYLNTGKELPAKPVMLTFDDTDEDQYTIALPELNKYGFKGVFFIMTVSLGRPRYMDREQVKQLSDQGHTIGSHTWDHHDVNHYTDNDWIRQIEKPTKDLEQITGKKIEYFAYPFGLWNPQAIPQLKDRGFIAAFQLSAKRDQQDPLYTIRRIIVPGSWSTSTMFRAMHNSFH
ncbi:MAG: polysaccharide deacetylase [Bacteroidetes bacterium]|nr:MAG: polysaccharide deacetylase [Bacteroidota bacterium]